MIETGLIVMILAALTRMLMQGIQCSVPIALIILSYCVLFGVYFGVQKLLQQVKLFCMIWYGACFLGTMVFFTLLRFGIITMMNHILTCVNEYYLIAVALFSMDQKNDKYVLLLFVMFHALLLPLIDIKRRETLAFVVLLQLVIVTVVIVLLLGYAPDFGAVFIISLGLLVYRMSMKAEWNLRLYDKCIVGCSIVVVLGMISLFTFLVSGNMEDKYESYMRFQKNMEHYFSFASYSNYSDGRLSNRAPKYTHKNVIRVNSDSLPTNRIYLKGFVGQNLQSYEWSNLPQSTFYKDMKQKEEKEITCSKRIESMEYNVLYKYFPTNKQKLSIFCGGVKDQYMYAPYFSNYENNENYIIANGDGNFYRNQTSISQVEYMPLNTVYQYCEMTERNDAQQQKESEAYKKYCYAQYRNVEENQRKKLLEFLGNPESLSEEEAVALVKDKLQRHCEYSLKLNSLKFGEDYVDHFLFVEKKGYCCHFATAATLMFRSLGIPARYVTGYVAEQKDFKADGSGYVAEVKDDNAHAWTEIYYDPIGWIPVETTPGGGMTDTAFEKTIFDDTEDDVYADEDGSYSQQSAADNVSATATTQTTQGQNDEQMKMTDHNSKLNANGSNKGMQGKSSLGLKVIRIIGEVMGFLIVIALCLLMLRMVIILVLRKQRMAKDCKKAVLATKRQIMAMFFVYGIVRRKQELEKDYFLRGVEILYGANMQKYRWVHWLKYRVAGEKNKFRYDENNMLEDHFGLTEKIVPEGDSDSENKKKYSETLTILANQFYVCLEKSQFSHVSLTEDDVVLANQLFDCVFKHEIE